jgi:hypothetical protein
MYARKEKFMIWMKVGWSGTWKEDWFREGGWVTIREGGGV